MLLPRDTNLKLRIEKAIDAFETSARDPNNDNDAYYYRLLEEIKEGVADWMIERAGGTNGTFALVMEQTAKGFREAMDSQREVSASSSSTPLPRSQRDRLSCGLLSQP